MSQTPSARQLPSAPRPTGVAALTRRQKAAIVVRYLTAEGADVPLKDLPEDMQLELTRQIGSMRYIDRKTLAAVVAEFARELESVGLSFPRDLAGALNALDGKISPYTAARLRREAGVRQSGDPWERLAALEVPKLQDLLEQESIEVCAVVLSKLEVKKAAELLGKMPGDRARRITFAVSQTEKITPDAVYRIGVSLASQLDDVPEKAFDAEPVKRVGAILNFSPAATREEVLEGLAAEDEEFANAVRKAIFTFANIATRILKTDVPKIIRDVDQAELVTALAFAVQKGGEMEESANFILENMSKRMAEGLREEMNEKGKVKGKDGEAAMTEVVGAIRRLEEFGEITMVIEEEDDEDEDD